MKRFAFLVVIAATMALTPAALAAGTLSGKYKETISGDSALGGALNATWVLKLSNGHYRVSDNGTVVVHGKYKIKGNKITVFGGTGEASCPAKGTYKFTLTGTKLKFKVVSDSNPACIGRKLLLTHGTFTKIG
jgi:hypothetical protein